MLIYIYPLVYYQQLLIPPYTVITHARTAMRRTIAPINTSCVLRAALPSAPAPSACMRRAPQLRI